LEAQRQSAAAAAAQAKKQKRQQEAEEELRQKDTQEAERRIKEADAKRVRQREADEKEAQEADRQKQQREQEQLEQQEAAVRKRLQTQRVAAERNLEQAAGLPSRAKVKEPQKALLTALSRAPAKNDTGPCDKCDGPHATDACPHFKKARDKHKDAWDHYGDAGSGDDQGEKRKLVRNGRVVPQPGDGSCLFHSLAHGLGSVSASELRARLADYITSHPDVEVAGNPIKDWVLWDSGLDTTTYAKSMRSGSRWGGAVELAVCAKVQRVQVDVYERSAGGFIRISSFETDGCAALSTVNLLYGGRVHYDALVL